MNWVFSNRIYKAHANINNIKPTCLLARDCFKGELKWNWNEEQYTRREHQNNSIHLSHVDFGV